MGKKISILIAFIVATLLSDLTFADCGSSCGYNCWG